MPDALLHALLMNVAILVVGMGLLWRVAVRIGDVSFIDAVWGGGMGVLAMASWLHVSGGPGARASLIAAMAVIWSSVNKAKFVSVPGRPGLS
uniref:DUF1295 domain-containing protein n=1 Tax=Novosphingobium sp. CCH12-A3 TaxID=1768752 RepID=UPI000AE83720